MESFFDDSGPDGTRLIHDSMSCTHSQDKQQRSVVRVTSPLRLPPSSAILFLEIENSNKMFITL